MAHSPHKIVSTLEALISSIDHDEQVYRWFAFLAGQPNIKAKFGKEGAGKDLYRHLQSTGARRKMLGLTALFFMTGVLYFEQMPYLWVTVLFLFPFAKLEHDHKKWVKEISTQLLVHDFEPAELRQKTLYQISEIYSRKYNIPSFVDAVYFADAITRKSILLAVICLPFVIQMSLWQAVFMIAGAYYVPHLIASHPIVFKRLK